MCGSSKKCCGSNCGCWVYIICCKELQVWWYVLLLFYAVLGLRMCVLLLYLPLHCTVYSLYWSEESHVSKAQHWPGWAPQNRRQHRKPNPGRPCLIVGPWPAHAEDGLAGLGNTPWRLWDGRQATVPTQAVGLTVPSSSRNKFPNLFKPPMA